MDGAALSSLCDRYLVVSQRQEKDWFIQVRIGEGKKKFLLQEEIVQS